MDTEWTKFCQSFVHNNINGSDDKCQSVAFQAARPMKSIDLAVNNRTNTNSLHFSILTISDNVFECKYALNIEFVLLV